MEVKNNSLKSSLGRNSARLFLAGIVMVLFFTYMGSFSNVLNQKMEYGLILLSHKNDFYPENRLQKINDEAGLQGKTVFTPLALRNEEVSGVANNTIITSDPRILAMRQFLIDYNSPLYPYASVFVVEADKYDLDWRLVAAISGVESAFGNIVPYRSNNAWGWKGDPTRDWSHFTSWSQGIAVVTERMAKGYGTDLTPFEIEPTYCPPCGANPAHAWANGVTRFMSELDYYLENLE